MNQTVPFRYRYLEGIGSEETQNSWRAALDRTIANHPAFLIVHGEGGTGRSTLAAQSALRLYSFEDNKIAWKCGASSSAPQAITFDGAEAPMCIVIDDCDMHAGMSRWWDHLELAWEAEVDIVLVAGWKNLEQIHSMLGPRWARRFNRGGLAIQTAWAPF